MDAILKRRSRSTPRSTNKALRPNDRHAAIVQALYEHGPLPTAYLHQLVDPTSDYTRFQKLVGDMFHEDNAPHGGRYLARPWQLNPQNDHSHFVVSEATPNGEKLLREYGRYNPEAKASAGGSYPHMFMTACITASIAVAARRHGLRFISRAEILAASPNKTLSIAAPISYGSKRHAKPMTADAMFGLQYPSGGKLYFLIEADLNNEPVRRADFNTTSYLRKVLQYREVIGGGIYKRHFGIEQGLMALTLTCNREHATNVVEMIGEELGKAAYLPVAALPQFDGPFSVPGIIENILDIPFRRAGYPDVRLSQFE